MEETCGWGWRVGVDEGVGGPHHCPQTKPPKSRDIAGESAAKNVGEGGGWEC